MNGPCYRRPRGNVVDLAGCSTAVWRDRQWWVTESARVGTNCVSIEATVAAVVARLHIVCEST